MKILAVFALVGVSILVHSPVMAFDPLRPHPGKPAASGEPRTLQWDELIPPEERDKPFVPSQGIQPLFDDESGPGAMQMGSAAVNKQLEGQWVRIPGYAVPLEVTDQHLVKTFLLVPYFGACIHVPPPPPNQTVFVEAQSPFRLSSMYDPVWVVGKMSTKGASTGMADTSYSINGTKIEKYEERP